MTGVPARDVAATVFLDAALFFLFAAICFAVAWPPPPLDAARRALRLAPRDAVSVVICGSMKTVAMGVPLISVMYKAVPYAGLLALPLILYHALQVLLGGLALGPLKRWNLAATEREAARAAAAKEKAARGLPRAASGVADDVADGGPALRFSQRFSRHWSFIRLLPKS